MYRWLVNGNDFAFLFVVFPHPFAFRSLFCFFCLFDKKSFGPAGICAMGGLFCERIDHTPGATGTPFKGETNRSRWWGGAKREKTTVGTHESLPPEVFFLLLFFYAIRGRSRYRWATAGRYLTAIRKQNVAVLIRCDECTIISMT